MSLKKIKFGNKEVNKKEFYSSKQALSLDSVDLDKIVVSKKWKINDTTYKQLNILMMVEKICHLLQMMRKFIKSIIKYGK